MEQCSAAGVEAFYATALEVQISKSVLSSQIKKSFVYSYFGIC